MSVGVNVSRPMRGAIIWSSLAHLLANAESIAMRAAKRLYVVSLDVVRHHQPSPFRWRHLCAVGAANERARGAKRHDETGKSIYFMRHRYALVNVQQFLRVFRLHARGGRQSRHVHVACVCVSVCRISEWGPSHPHSCLYLVLYSTWQQSFGLIGIVSSISTLILDAL